MDELVLTKPANYTSNLALRKRIMAEFQPIPVCVFWWLSNLPRNHACVLSTGAGQLVGQWYFLGRTSTKLSVRWCLRISGCQRICPPSHGGRQHHAAGQSKCWYEDMGLMLPSLNRVSERDICVLRYR